MLLRPGLVVCWHHSKKLDIKWDIVRMYTSWPPEYRNVVFVQPATEVVMTVLSVETVVLGSAWVLGMLVGESVRYTQVIRQPDGALQCTADDRFEIREV